MSIFRRKTPSVKVGIAPPAKLAPLAHEFVTLKGEERLKDYLYHIDAIQQLAIKAKNHEYFKNPKREGEDMNEYLQEWLTKAADLVEKYKDFKGIPASMKLTQDEKQNNPHLDKKALTSGGKGRKAKKSLKKRRSRKGKSRRGTKKTKK